jgi:putative flippase GtrA
MTLALRPVVTSPGGLSSWLRSANGSKLVRYSLASITSVAVGESILLLTYGLLRWSAVVANLVATAVATLPSYYLNRRWVWGKTGRSHVLKEVVPFWVLAFVGLAVSTFAVDIADRWAKDLGLPHATTTLVVNTAWLAALGVVWVGKFLVFEHLMFVHRDRRAEEVPLPPSVVDVDAGSLGQPLTSDSWS